MSKKGLGRGFESLIPTDVLDEAFDPTVSSDEQISELRYIRTDDIEPDPQQPRRMFDKDALDELAASIKEHGVLQPIIVAPGKNGFVIVAGERRWRAASQAGLAKIPALVRTLSGQHKLELALIENLQREDLNPMETATAYAKLKSQFNLTIEQIGQRVGGKSIQAISNYMRLLQLPDFAKKAVADRKITEGHARQLLALSGDEAAQRDLLKHIEKEGWSVRKAEQYVIGYKKGDQQQDKRVAAVRSTKTHTDFTEQFSQRIALPVVQKTMGGGRGQIIISYATDEELQRLQQLLGS